MCKLHSAYFKFPWQLEVAEVFGCSLSFAVLCTQNEPGWELGYRGWGKTPPLDKGTAKSMVKDEHKYKELVHSSYGKKRLYLLPLTSFWQQINKFSHFSFFFFSLHSCSYKSLAINLREESVTKPSLSLKI